VIFGLCSFAGGGRVDGAEWPGWRSSLPATGAGWEGVGAIAAVVCCVQARSGQQLASTAPAHGSSPSADWRAALCQLHTAVLDRMFPVQFSLPTHISPFLTLVVTTGTLSSSQLLTGINTAALIS